MDAMLKIPRKAIAAAKQKLKRPFIGFLLSVDRSGPNRLHSPLYFPSTSCPIRWTWPSASLIVSAAALFFAPFLARQARAVTVFPLLSSKSRRDVPLLFRAGTEMVSKVQEFTAPLGSFTSM